MRNSIRSLLLVVASLAASSASGFPYELSYSGRLTDLGGKPLQGTIDLDARFFDVDTGGAPLADIVLAFPETPLNSGVFQVRLVMTSEQFHSVFEREAAFIEFTDSKTQRVFARQKFNLVPFALKIPVDAKTLRYDAKGQLTVKFANDNGSGTVELKAASTAGDLSLTLPTVQGTANQVLKTDGAGNLRWENDLIGGVGTITASDLMDNTIMDTDIASNAAIVDTKLAVISTAGKVADSALSTNVTRLGSVIELSSSEVTGVLDVANGGTGATSLSGVLIGSGSGPVGGLASTGASQYLRRNVGNTAYEFAGLGALAALSSVSGGAGGTIGDNSIDDNDVNALSMTKVSGLTAALAAKGDVFAGGQLGALSIGTINASNLSLLTDGSPRVTVDSLGQVGIGTATPGAGLQVNGTFKLVDGSQGASKVLTSDAAGLASWQSTSPGVPTGAVMFFNLASCPSGWTSFGAAAGRVIVGLSGGGSLAANVGTALTDQGLRQITSVPAHTHSVDPPAASSSTDPGHSHSINPPSTATDAQGNHAHTFTRANQWAGGGSNGSEALVAGAGMLAWGAQGTSAAGNHAHNVDIGAFASTSGGAHGHTFDIASFASASTGAAAVDVSMPYVQLLACQKN